MYLQISSEDKIYFIDTKEEVFNQDVIDDLDVRNINDIISNFEVYVYDYTAGSDCDVEFDDWDIGDNDEVTLNYTMQAKVSLLEIFQYCFSGMKVKEITKGQYNDRENIIPPYRCKLTMDLFNDKESH